jgi:hypothetical protein
MHPKFFNYLFFKLVISLFIYGSLYSEVSAQVSRMDTTGISFIVKIPDISYKIKIMMQPVRKDGSSFKTLDDFLLYMTLNDKYMFDFTRLIARITEHYKLDKYGFVFQEEKSDKGRLYFSFLADKNSQDPFENEDLLLHQNYTPNHWFKEYLKDNEKAVQHRSKHSLSFIVPSGNYLIIPNNGYVSLYDFSNKASREEIVDFWKHVYLLKQLLNQKGLKSNLNAHVGSHGFQTVPHFHLRFTIK